jgi:hypothetical protein
MQHYRRYRSGNSPHINVSLTQQYYVGLLAAAN